MIPRSGGGGQEVNGRKADEVFAEHGICPQLRAVHQPPETSTPARRMRFSRTTGERRPPTGSLSEDLDYSTAVSGSEPHGGVCSRDEAAFPDLIHPVVPKDTGAPQLDAVNEHLRAQIAPTPQPGGTQAPNGVEEGGKLTRLGELFTSDQVPVAAGPTVPGTAPGGAGGGKEGQANNCCEAYRSHDTSTPYWGSDECETNSIRIQQQSTAG